MMQSRHLPPRWIHICPDHLGFPVSAGVVSTQELSCFQEQTHSSKPSCAAMATATVTIEKITGESYQKLGHMREWMEHPQSMKASAGLSP